MAIDHSASEEHLWSLVHEVEKVVTSPYAAALEGLKSLVSTSSHADLIFWAECKPCQVSLLAGAVLEQISRSQAALYLLRRFACVRQFRNYLLVQEPILLDQLLQQAVKNGSSEVFQACIAILSHPWPSSAAIPASFQTFLSQLINNMVLHPCKTTIDALYQATKFLAGHEGILYALSDEVMIEFQRECTKILRNLKDHMGNLLCLAIFARISLIHNGSSQTASLLSQGQTTSSWIQDARAFFGSKRAHKTLDLIFLQATLACSEDSEVAEGQVVIKWLELAIEICDAIQVSQRQEWVGRNPMRISKLKAKLSRNNIDKSLQGLGGVFLITLLAPTNSLKEYGATICGFLGSTESWKDVQGLSDRVCQTTINYFMKHSDVSTLSNLITGWVSSTEVPPGTLSVSQISLVRFFVAKIQHLDFVTDHSKLFQAMHPVLGRSTVETNNNTFQASTTEGDCRGLLVCHRTYFDARNLLLSDIGRLYALAATLISAPATKNRAYLSFIKQTQPVRCIFMGRRIYRRPDALAINFSLEGEGHGSNSSIDWRRKMEALFLQNARISYQSVLVEVGRICHDLETRCHEVEAPVRAMKIELERLKSQLTATNIEKDELSSRLEKLSNLVTVQNEEISCLKSQELDNAAKKRQATESLATANHELEIVKQNLQVLAAEKKIFKTLELDLMASLTDREDQLEELRKTADIVNRENDDLMKKSERFAEEESAIKAKLQLVEAENSHLKQSLDGKTELCCAKDQDINDLKKDNMSLSRELNGLQLQSLQDRTDVEVFRIKTESDRQRHESDITDLQQQLEKQKKDVELRKMQYLEERNILQNTLENAEVSRKTELQEEKRKNHILKKKVELLRNERYAKIRDYSEAQEHINRLMDVMGFADKNSKFQRKNGTNKLKVSAMPLGHNNSAMRSVDDLNSTPEMQILEHSFDSASSTSPIEPSPKRSRKVIHTEIPRLDPSRSDSISIIEPNRAKDTSRPPLGPADINCLIGIKNNQTSAHGFDDSTEPQLQLGRQSSKASLDEIDLNFDESDIFTSTASV